MSEIKDTNNRIGIIVEDRGSALIARPVGVEPVIDDANGVTGVAGAQLTTATAWHLDNTTGQYRGLWFDSPAGQFLSAVKI